jgi:ABC-2 type transport system permease protein
VGVIMSVFSKLDIKRRNLCSPVRLFNINLQLFFGNLSFALVAWGVMVIASLVLYGGSMWTNNGLFLVLNSLVFSLTALSISFLIATLVSSKSAQNAIANVMTLGFCFIGGVFVPQQLLGKSVLSIASFTPTYWYVKANNIIGSMVNFSQENLMPVFIAIMIEIAFGIAVLGVTLVMIKQKQREQ